MRKRVRHYGITTIPSPVSVPYPDCRRVMRLRVSPIPFDDIYLFYHFHRLFCRLWLAFIMSSSLGIFPLRSLLHLPRSKFQSLPALVTITQASHQRVCSPRRAAASAWVSRSISIRCSRPRSPPADDFKEYCITQMVHVIAFALTLTIAHVPKCLSYTFVVLAATTALSSNCR